MLENLRDILKVFFYILCAFSIPVFTFATVFEPINYVILCVKQRKIVPIKEAAKKYELNRTVVLPVLYFCGLCCALGLFFFGGYTEAYVDNAKEEAYRQGYEDGLEEATSSTWEEGYEYGFEAGLEEATGDGYLSGYEEGKNDGYSTGYDAGYDLGYRTGYSEGFEVLKNRWLEKGYPYSRDDFREQYQTVTVPQNQSGATYQPQQTQQNSYTVYVTDTGSKYHRGGCQYLRESKIPMSLSDAIASGYTACSKCNP